jgi:hypothetical protein
MGEVLGLELWDGQREIVASVIRGVHRWTTVKAGQKTGKTDVAAGLAIWWPLFRADGEVHITSPTYETTKKTVWKAIRRLIRAGNERLPGGWVLGPEPSIDPLTGWRLTGDRGIDAIATNNPTAAAGRSGPGQLWIIDEASGFQEELWPVVFGNTTGGGKILAISNPTDVAGTFYDSHTRDRTRWNCHTLDARRTPNFFGHRVPGLADPESVALLRDKYGEDSAFFDVRVRGDFPRQGANSVISLALVERSIRARELAEADGQLEVDDGARLSLGVDVAREGDDDSVVTARRGLVVLEQVSVHGADGPAVAGLVLNAVERLRGRGDTGARRPRVKIDGTGLGASPLDYLREAERAADISVIDVRFGATALESARFELVRDELWWVVREWLEEGGLLPIGLPALESELVAPVYSFTARGKIRVSSKDDLKKVLHRSPDRADSLALALYEPPEIIGSAGASSPRKLRNLGGF